MLILQEIIFSDTIVSTKYIITYIASVHSPAHVSYMQVPSATQKRT